MSGGYSMRLETEEERQRKQQTENANQEKYDTPIKYLKILTVLILILSFLTNQVFLVLIALFFFLASIAAEVLQDKFGIQLNFLWNIAALAIIVLAFWYTVQYKGFNGIIDTLMSGILVTVFAALVLVPILKRSKLTKDA
jgi:K+-sensing histidine kinase KdpD